MKFALGLLISFTVGVGCRWLDIPVGSPPVVPGALLVLAMTLGYTGMDKLLLRRSAPPASTAALCGGPSGTTRQQAEQDARTL